MTSVNVTTTKNTVTVNGETRVVTVKTAGPQGPAFANGTYGDIVVSNDGADLNIATGAIVNADISNSAGIQGSKILPSFGSQNVTTSGNFQCGGGVFTFSNDAGGKIRFLDTNNNPDYTIESNQGLFQIYQSSGDPIIKVNTDKQVDINYNLDLAAGLDVTGIITGTSHLDLPDDAKLKLGDNDEFEIFHRGSDGVSLINEYGGGYLSLGSNGSRIEMYDIANSRTMAQFNTGGACVFKHAADIRLETTSTGIDVTGDISVSGTLTGVSDTVNPVIQINGLGPNFIRFDSGANTPSDSIDLIYRTTPNTLAFERVGDSQIMFSVDADDQQAIFNGNVDCNAGLDVTSGDLTVATGHLTVTEGDLDVTDGDLTVSAGALFVDYAGDRVGMGTTSPQANLHIKSQTDCILMLEGDSNNTVGNENRNPYILFVQDGFVQNSVIGLNPYNVTAESNSLIFANSTGSNGGIIFKTGNTASYTNAVTRMEIASDGSVFLHNGLTVKDASGSDPTLHLQHSDYDVLGEVFRIGDNIPTSVRYHSIKAQNSQTDSNNLISFHLHDGGGFPRTGQHEVLKLQGNKQVTIAGNLDVGEGIDVTGDATSTTGFAAGTTSLGTAVRFHAFSNNTHIGHQIIIEQDGAGDAVLGWALTGTRAWSAGIDNSDSNKWKLSSGASVDANTQITIEQDGFVGLHHDSGTTPKLQTTATGVNINGNLDIDGGTLVLDTGPNSPNTNYGLQEAIRIDDSGNTVDRALNIYEYREGGGRFFTLNYNLASGSTGSAYTFTQGNYGSSSMIRFDGFIKFFVNAANDPEQNVITPTKRFEINTTGAALPDNAQLHLGNDGDLKIYHDSQNSYIQETGEGNLFIDSSFFTLRNGGGTETVATFTHGTGAAGGCRLHFGGATTPKFFTNSTGVTVNGQVDINGASYARTMYQSSGSNMWSVGLRASASGDTNYHIFREAGNTGEVEIGAKINANGGLGVTGGITYSTTSIASGTLEFASTLASYDPTEDGGGSDTSTTTAISLMHGHSIAVNRSGYIRNILKIDTESSGSHIEIGRSSTDYIGDIKLLPGNGHKVVANYDGDPKFETSSTGITTQGSVLATSHFRNSVPSDFWSNGTHVAVGDLGHIGTHGAFELTLTSGGYRRQVNGVGKWKDLTVDGVSGFGCQVALAPKTGKIHFRSNSGLSTDDNNPSGAGLADRMVVSTTGVDITGKATMTESNASTSNNLRKITTSTAQPSGGNDGDIWIVVPS